MNKRAYLLLGCLSVVLITILAIYINMLVGYFTMPEDDFFRVYIEAFIVAISLVTLGIILPLGANMIVLVKCIKHNLDIGQQFKALNKLSRFEKITSILLGTIFVFFTIETTQYINVSPIVESTCWVVLWILLLVNIYNIVMCLIKKHIYSATILFASIMMCFACFSLRQVIQHMQTQSAEYETNESQTSRNN